MHYLNNPIAKTANSTVIDGIEIKLDLENIPSNRPELLSKSDNFKREMGKEEFVKLWQGVCRFSTKPEQLANIKILYDRWETIEESKIIHTSEGSTLRLLNRKDGKEQAIVKKFYIGHKDHEDDYYKKSAFIIQTYFIIIHTNLLYFSGICLNKWYVGDEICIIMEPLDKTLKEYVQEKYAKNGDGIDEKECKVIITDLLDNLWTFHISGNIHTDIKPSNIMLRDKQDRKEYNGWKIIDFDNRRFLGLRGKYNYSKSATGTIGWIPPEVHPTKPDQIFKEKVIILVMDMISGNLD